MVTIKGPISIGPNMTDKDRAKLGGCLKDQMGFSEVPKAKPKKPKSKKSKKKSSKRKVK